MSCLLSNFFVLWTRALHPRTTHLARKVTTSDLVFFLCRLLPGSPGVVGIVNLSNEDQVVDLSALRLLPAELAVIASGVDCAVEKGYDAYYLVLQLNVPQVMEIPKK